MLRMLPRLITGQGDFTGSIILLMRPSPSPKPKLWAKEKFRLWAVSKILWATTIKQTNPQP